MNYGKVEERSSSRSRSPNTARRAATFAIPTDILSRSGRAQTSRTADARPGKSILIVPERVVGDLYNGMKACWPDRSRKPARGRLFLFQRARPLLARDSRFAMIFLKGIANRQK